MNTLNKQEIKHAINGLFGMYVTKTKQGKIVPCKNEDIYNISDNNFYMDTDGTLIKRSETK